jgi:protein phosphatase methylesterase 1
MSDLYRSAIHARLSKLPPMPPPEDDEYDEGDEEEETDSLGSLPSMMLPPKVPSHRIPNADYAPISASGYFDQALEVTVPSSQLQFRIYYTPPKLSNGTVMVCHHGAGYSGLSFACFAQETTRISNGECGVLALDARRHGRP